jgi:hypothetical protein
MMGSPFIWATWQGSGEEMAPDGAIARMQSELLQNAMSLTFVAPPVIDEWMRGIDPLDIWPADVQPVSVIGVAGLGESGQDEAILVVAQDEVGMYFWYGLLTAEGGFANQIGEPPAAIAIVVGLEQPQLNWLPTDVRQVLVLGSVGIFDGPSSLSNQIGTTARGQTFVVLGVSADGQWWAIPCPVASGTCWISANPTFVRPLDGPPPAITATPVPAYTTPTPLPPVYPTATPLPAQPERIQFAPGQERAVRSGPLWANTVRQFVFYAAAGQTPTVRLSSPSPAASFWIVGMRDGVIYKSQGNPSRDYTYLAPLSQDYLISIVAPVNTSFTLELIMPRPGPTPQPTVQPAPERISFGPGQTSGCAQWRIAEWDRQAVRVPGIGRPGGEDLVVRSSGQRCQFLGARCERRRTVQIVRRSVARVVVPASAHARLPDYDLSFRAIELHARIAHSTAISYTHGCSVDSSSADCYAACNGDNAADRGAANRDTYAGDRRRQRRHSCRQLLRLP